MTNDSAVLQKEQLPPKSRGTSLVRIESPLVVGSLVVVLLMSVQALVIAQPSSNEDDKASGLSRLKEMTTQYQLWIQNDKEAKLQLEPNPVLRWSNPIRRTVDGGVFLWTHDGRPQVALAIWISESRFGHSFQSLAEVPVVAKREGTKLWYPKEAGIIFHPVPDVRRPADRRVRRLRQMRTIAGSFSARIDRIDKQGIHTIKPLRVLTQPLYRYPDARGGRDGAVFAFAQATDPEVLLILELRDLTDLESTWHYGLARMSMVPLLVTYGQTEVWRTDWARHRNPESTYFSKAYPLNR